MALITSTPSGDQQVQHHQGLFLQDLIDLAGAAGIAAKDLFVVLSFPEVEHGLTRIVRAVADSTTEPGKAPTGVLCLGLTDEAISCIQVS